MPLTLPTTIDVEVAEQNPLAVLGRVHIHRIEQLAHDHATAEQRAVAGVTTVTGGL